MKRRFIIAISFFFIVASASVSFLQFHYFEQERMSLIDQQIDRSVSAILSSNLSVSALSSQEDIEDAVYSALEDEPLNQFILMSDRSGRLLYRNQLAEDENIQLPFTTEKQLLESGGHLFRYGTYFLPDNVRVLQVGLALDQRKILWDRIKWRTIALSGALTLLLIVFAVMLTNYLLRPLRELALYFEYQASNPEHGKPIPSFTRDSEEFSMLAKSVQTATERWQSLLQHHGSLLARLAHEIRTPLTIVNNKLESLKPENDEALRLKREAIEELRHAESVARDFMGWSKLEFSPDSEPELHAISLPEFASGLSCVKSFAGLVTENNLRKPGKIFAKPEHLRLIFENLLENASRYGEAGKPVYLRIDDNGFEVASFGQEIAASVRANFGKPFNRGSNRTDSTGIGIANITSVCKRYGWRLEYSRQDGARNVFRICV